MKKEQQKAAGEEERKSSSMGAFTRRTRRPSGRGARCGGGVMARWWRWSGGWHRWTVELVARRHAGLAAAAAGGGRSGEGGRDGDARPDLGMEQR